MGDDSKVKDAADIVKGIVEHVPCIRIWFSPLLRR